MGGGKEEKGGKEVQVEERRTASMGGMKWKIRHREGMRVAVSGWEGKTVAMTEVGRGR